MRFHEPGGLAPPETLAALQLLGAGSDGLTVGGLAAVGYRFALTGGLAPPGTPSLAWPLSSLRLRPSGSQPQENRRCAFRGLAPPDPRLSRGPKKTLAP